jgi:hypothetical protein
MAVYHFVEMVGLEVGTRSVMRDQIPSPGHNIRANSHMAGIATTTRTTMHHHRSQAGSHPHLESQDLQEAHLHLHLHQAHMAPTPMLSPIKRNPAPRLTVIGISLQHRNSDMMRPTITEIIVMDVLILDLLATADIKELHEFEGLFAGT